MIAPSRVARSWLRAERNARLLGGGSVGGVGAASVTATGVTLFAVVAAGSYSRSTFDKLFVPLPELEINARASRPTATASGLAGRLMRDVTASASRSTTSKVDAL